MYILARIELIRCIYYDYEKKSYTKSFSKIHLLDPFPNSPSSRHWLRFVDVKEQWTESEGTPGTVRNEFFICVYSGVTAEIFVACIRTNNAFRMANLWASDRTASFIWWIKLVKDSLWLPCLVISYKTMINILLKACITNQLSESQIGIQRFFARCGNYLQQLFAIVPGNDNDTQWRHPSPRYDECRTIIKIGSLSSAPSILGVGNLYKPGSQNWALNCIRGPQLKIQFNFTKFDIKCHAGRSLATPVLSAKRRRSVQGRSYGKLLGGMQPRFANKQVKCTVHLTTELSIWGVAPLQPFWIRPWQCVDVIGSLLWLLNIVVLSPHKSMGLYGQPGNGVHQYINMCTWNKCIWISLWYKYICGKSK